MTVTVEQPIFGLAAARISVLNPLPRPPTSPRGAIIFVAEERAAAFVRAGYAVRVATAKLGRAQKDLLAYLYRETLDIEGERQDLVQRVAAISVLSPRAPMTRVPWSSKAAIETLGKLVTPSAMSQALEKLEYRGLVFRERDMSGVRPRTTSVQLTDAGRCLARALIEDSAETLNVDHE